jgi:aspartate/methionine/tyrosine aminotransferase
MLSVCHPHNPLGLLWNQDEVIAITKFCSERGIALLSDEVWSDVVLDGAPFSSFAAHATAACAPWVIYGLSKGYGIAGLRIGAIVAPSDDAAARFAATMGFDQTIEGAATLSQVAATGALQHGGPWLAEFLRHCAAQRDMATARLSKLRGLRIESPPRATFVLFVDVRGTGLDMTLFH